MPLAWRNSVQVGKAKGGNEANDLTYGAIEEN